MSRAWINRSSEAVEAFRAQREAYKTWSAEIMAAAKALGTDGPFGHRVFDGSWTITGLAPKRGAEDPAGWRWTPSRKCLRPIPGKAGEPAREWLKAWPGISSPTALMTHKFGLGWTSRTATDPQTGQSRVAWATVGIVQGGDSEAVLAHHEFDRVDRMGDGWVEIPLSQYHALREASGVAA